MPRINARRRHGNTIALLRLVIAILLTALPLTTFATEPAFDRGVKAYQAKKYDEAFRHWSEAASHGNVEALNNLGYLLSNGYGVEKDAEKATDLWRTAAYAGVSESQWHLGDAYQDGKGVKKDRARAYAWYRCAVASATRELAQGEDKIEKAILKGAEESLQYLVTLLSKEELERGKELATKCIERYAEPAL